MYCYTILKNNNHYKYQLFKSKDLELSKLSKCEINKKSITNVLSHHLLESVVYFNDIVKR